jgi:hypothetical protein
VPLQDPRSAATCSPVNARGNPANFQDAVAGTALASPAAVRLSACANIRNDRSAVAIRCAAVGRPPHRSTMNTPTSAAVSPPKSSWASVHQAVKKRADQIPFRSMVVWASPRSRAK